MNNMKSFFKKVFTLKFIWRFLFVIGVINLITQAFVSVFLLMCYGNQKLPHVYSIWIGATILSLLLSGVICAINNRKDIKSFLNTFK